MPFSKDTFISVLIGSQISYLMPLSIIAFIPSTPELFLKDYYETSQGDSSTSCVLCVITSRIKVKVTININNPLCVITFEPEVIEISVRLHNVPDRNIYQMCHCFCVM